ncbi:MAG: hypothetical protein ACI87E_000429 [Mariniblastus sp.]|jgi:hypothetical protein
MKSILIPVVFVALFTLSGFGSTAVHAQGTRNLGRPLIRQASPAAGNNAIGQIQGGERFLRANRQASDFVGSNQGDASGFVGLTQGRVSGEIASSTGGLIEQADLTFQINQPFPAMSRDEPYPPRLVLGADFPVELASKRIGNIVKSLNQKLNRVAGTSVEVSVAGRKAIIHGEVTSSRERDLAEILLLFEPGIDSVQNNLKLNRPDSVPPKRQSSPPNR